MTNLIEIVARAMCKRAGSDPNGADMFGRPNWAHPTFVNDAITVIPLVIEAAAEQFDREGDCSISARNVAAAIRALGDSHD